MQKQHLIDPEICIRCYTCEQSCPIGAITHDENNVVVDFDKCKFCMNCVAPCPTGSIDNWRIIEKPYTVEEQLSWLELPEQIEFEQGSVDSEAQLESLDEETAALLEIAHAATGGRTRPPASALKPSINLFDAEHPAVAMVKGNFRLTNAESDTDVRHIILDFASIGFPVLEGQSIGIIPPGKDENGRRFTPRLYSVSSPRDGERPHTNNLSLTVKREKHGVCSNFICDFELGQEVEVTGPYGSTFLLPNDPAARLIMICTGTGSAPFRAFTMQRQRTMPETNGTMVLFFGARTPDSLPYFGPLKKIPQTFLQKHFAFSRDKTLPKEYVQDKIRATRQEIAGALSDLNSYIYLCGLKAMEQGVEDALSEIAQSAGMNWPDIRQLMIEQGRYHVETY